MKDIFGGKKMKHKILSSLAAISLALLLCSCGNNDDEPKNTEPTDAITTAISFTEAPADTAQTSDTASEYDELLAVSEELDSLRTSYSKLTIGLYFAGNRDGDNYDGTLAIKVQLGKLKPSVCIIYDNESFTMSAPEADPNAQSLSENGFLVLNPDQMLIFQRVVDGKTYLRLFEIEKNKDIIPITITPDEDYSDIILNDSEFISENFSFSTNQYKNFSDNTVYGDDLNDYALCCYDYGESRYIEWLVDLYSDTAQISGSLDYHADNDIAAALEKAKSALYMAHGYENSFDNTYEEYLTYIGNDEELEEGYYRISPEFAGSREELIARLSEPLTEKCAAMERITEEQLFGGDHSIFREDEYGLIYAAAYRGVPTRYMYDTVRVLTSDESTAHAVALGHTLDSTAMSDFYFSRENGEWKLDYGKSLSDDTAGSYFGNHSQYAFDQQWLYLFAYFDPFRINAGEEFTLKMSAIHSGSGVSLAETKDGELIFCRFIKAEDFDMNDIAELYAEDPPLQRITADTYEKEFTYNLPESGKYIFIAKCRYVSDNGETTDIISGPQTVHVK